jgi:hypothetical protein
MLPPDTSAVIEDDLRTAFSRYPALARIFKDWVDSYPAQESRQVIEIVNRLITEHARELTNSG